MVYVKINGQQYPATVYGKIQDMEYQGKSTKTIKLSMSYSDAASLFVSGCSWSIISDEEEFDNSDYNVAGPITDFRDGTLAIKMIKDPQMDVVDNTILNILFGEDI